MAIEFLRSLEPASANALARAVAVLPSRFDPDARLRSVARLDVAAAGAEDLRTEDAIEGELEQRARPGEQGTPAARAADGERRPTEATNREQRPPAARAKNGEQRPPTAHTADAGPHGVPESYAHDTAARTAEPLRPASAAKAHEPARSASSVPPQWVQPASRAAPSRADARDASPVARSAAAFSISAPLSESCVAQRLSQARDEGTRVQVSIGRIEVIAANAPQPAAPRRGSSPRNGTIALADYLRGTKAGAP